MHAEVEKVMSNLHVVGALSANDKLLTNDEWFDIHTPTTCRALYRVWAGEGRGTNIARVRSCVRNGISFVSSSFEDVATPRSGETGVKRFRMDTKAMQHFRMVTALTRASAGLVVLGETYRSDPGLKSQVNLLIEEVEDFLQLVTPHSQGLRSRYAARAVTTDSESKSPRPSSRFPASPSDKSDVSASAPPTCDGPPPWIAEVADPLP